MTPVAEGAGVALAYEQRGDGPAVLLVHGMADDAAGWRHVGEQLAPVARTIAYDRRGYGGSGAPEPYERTTVEEQAEDAAALLGALDAAPAVLCGRDFGAVICLDLCKRHAGLVRAAAVIDPPLFAFVPDATEALAKQRQTLEQALRDGGPERAVEAYLGDSGAVSQERVARARTAHRGFFADYGGLASWPVTRGELRSMAMPMAVVSSAAATAPVRAAADALAALVPAAERIDGDDVAPIVRRLLDPAK
jgi:pimeloyl-ACP methyl ester carboxylesterase